MKARVLSLWNSIYISEFLATSKLKFETNHNCEREEMWVLPQYLNETLTNVPRSRMCAEDKSAFLSTSMRDDEASTRTLLESYPEVAKKLLKKLATD